MNSISSLLRKHKIELFTVLVLLAISVMAHGLNMLNYPYFESDEGTYMSQAWSFATRGELAPYTYWYDHAPFGWIFISLWTFITGGFFSFGFSLNSGRVFMLVLHILSSLLLYLLARKFSGSKWVGIFSVLIFSLSPLAIFFQRRLLLDNIMTFWILLSLFLIVYFKDSLAKLWLSAAAFALSVLSKETAVVFLPVVLYSIYLAVRGQLDFVSTLTDTAKGKLLVIIQWLIVAGLIISLYPLYALSRGELFPSPNRVSLIETVREQMARGQTRIFDFESGLFWINLENWLKEDPILIILGVGSVILNLVIGVRNVNARLISLFALTYILFLMRGGLVLEFYIIPLIPLLALNIAYSAWYIVDYLKTGNFKALRFFPYTILAIYLLFAVFYFSNNSKDWYNIYRSDQTTSQITAVEWLLNNTGRNDFIVIDNYGYVDLNANNAFPDRRFDYYWKVDLDSEIRTDILGDDSKNIDILAVTPQLKRDLETSRSLVLSQEALANAQRVREFISDGWGVEIYRQRN